MGIHCVAGIKGYQPILDHSTSKLQCLAMIPGRMTPVAVLPADTIDAVISPRGLIYYMRKNRDVNQIEIQNYVSVSRDIDADLKARDQSASFKVGRYHSGGPVKGSISADDIRARTVSVDALRDDSLVVRDPQGRVLLTSGVFDGSPLNRAKDIPTQEPSGSTAIAANRIVANRIVVTDNGGGAARDGEEVRKMLEEYGFSIRGQVMRELASEFLALRKELQQISDKMEDYLRNHQAPVSASSDVAAPAQTSRAWSETGGLPGGVTDIGNPFIKTRR